MHKGSVVQITKGYYQWSYGTVVSIGKDNIVLIEIDDELTISCDVSDFEIISA